MRPLVLVLLVAGCAHHAAPRPAPVPEPPSTYPMPELRGLTVEQAQARLRAAGTRGSVEWREERCDTVLPAGAVCSTYPWTGAHTLARESLVVYVQAPAGAKGPGAIRTTAYAGDAAPLPKPAPAPPPPPKPAPNKPSFFK